jgi:hypothetical protein
MKFINGTYILNVTLEKLVLKNEVDEWQKLL